MYTHWVLPQITVTMHRSGIIQNLFLYINFLNLIEKLLKN